MRFGSPSVQQAVNACPTLVCGSSAGSLALAYSAYRQLALACAASLAGGPRRTAELRAFVPNAPSILLRNVYGWFTRIERGLYSLTPEGEIALARWAPVPVREDGRVQLSGRR